MTTRFGPVLRPDGTLFRLWAPDAKRVSLALPEGDPIPMRAGQEGFFELMRPDARAGQRYRFLIGDQPIPDPASRRQEGDVMGWSVVRADLPPLRRPTPPRPWHEVVLAELHVGTATPEGSFEALIGRLDHFVDCGITAIELMPVADFPGRRNWGYDGVLPFAPDEAYGSPAALRVLVDAAHERGLGVMLDVVYNHFGPEGNFLPLIARRFFTEAHHTPWGAAIDLEQPLVRRFFVENALMWLGEYDFDGLRFDAVHAFAPPGGDLLLAELAEACRALKPEAWLVLENDHNAARWLERDGDGQPRFYTAQWNDDAHHALHVTATGEGSGYYADYAEDPVAALGRALAEGFVYQGEASAHRDGQPRGEVSARLPPQAFVNFAQNHDQIGNRPLGDRLAAALEPERLAFLRFLLLMGPAIPMVFQGEEAGLETPFPFFCDFSGDLAEAVRQGRAREFSEFFATAGELPDPLAPETMEAARLPWERMTPAALAAFQTLAAQRRRLVWPLLATAYHGAELRREGAILSWRWGFDAGVLCLLANPDVVPSEIQLQPRQDGVTAGDAVFDGTHTRLGPWSACAWVEPT
ncbi:malto-oligosyltrehalose trehalohydrolase [Roseococcus sp. SYP-B2431]|uniref:malto-oligosyltrehalose trehalohydrolase n=1 Tax=Roseococcus sp. SYP-B2431 TaxID=2496640 RepID=UPI001039B82F|nr:malto-oligosyltrehalose trehalohydrolase [Roseococcus sp. SYP-B2431]TCH99379.1 malto-oligosyltrehalose trehalohydrolase [Roseococcus sp. SYP-B2431]